MPICSLVIRSLVCLKVHLYLLLRSSQKWKYYVATLHHKWVSRKVFQKLGQPRPLFRLFSVFQRNIITNFTSDQCEKLSCPSSIRRQDSNPRPPEREPPPITTRPGLFPWKVLETMTAERVDKIAMK